MKLKSYAKVNLSLNIVGKFRSKKHKIESLISFIDFYDLIYLKPIHSNKHKVYFMGKFARGINRKNTVSKLLNILDQKNYLTIKNLKLKSKKIFLNNLEWEGDP